MDALQNISIPESQATIDYAKEFTNTLSKTTKRNYASSIRQFFGVKNFEDITVEMIQVVDTNMANQWIKELIDKGSKKATVNSKIAALKSFYDFLSRRSIGIMTWNPFDTKEGCVRMKNATSSYTVNKNLTDNEVERILNAVPKTADRMIDKLNFKRDYIAIATMLLTGCRRNELSNIRLGDFETFDTTRVVRITGKGGKERVLIVPETLYQQILEYVKMRHLTMNDFDEYLLTQHAYRNGGQNGLIRRGLQLSDVGIHRIVKKYAEKAKLDVERVTPHAFRHTFATESFREGAKVEDVQDLLGHSNPNTTRRYDHINRTIDHSTSEALASKYGI